MMTERDDYIRRQAAIDLAKDIIVPYEDGSEYRHRCIDPMQIYELPAIDVIEVGKKYYMDAGFRVICGMEEVQKTKAGEGEGTLLLFPGNRYFIVERIV